MSGDRARVAWVDYAKGICIILVVMMHTTLGVEKAAGEVSALNGFIEWARPFRMPDFFLISGLFLSSRIARPWRDYLDSKVVHFAYFYLLWMTIQFLTKSWGIYQDGGVPGLAGGYLLGFVEPFGTLWFIYLLALFFVVVKAARRVPPLLMFIIGAALEAAPIETGWIVIDEFASRFVYFYAGYWLAPSIFTFAAAVGRLNPAGILAALFIWGVGNGWLVSHGWSHTLGLSLAMGFAGAGAVVSTGVLLSKFHLARAIRYFGENSIVIYLAFFLFMAGSRAVLLRSPVADQLSLVALIGTTLGVIGPLTIFWLTRHTRLSFLFRRPAWARLSPGRNGWHSAPHVTRARPQAP
jgi:uncharacterized membrane protein YcfT